MKKLILSAALAIFAVAAFAQTKAKSNTDVSATAKGKTHKGQDKGTEVSGTAKVKSDVEFRGDDVNHDGKLSPEEKAARKETRRDETKARKADRTDDRIENGSVTDNNVHGKTVSDVATSTTLEGREKGAEISGVAKIKSEGEIRRDVKNDGELSAEEKAARRDARQARKADRADDGLLNGTVTDKNIHGTATSGTAVGTTLQGRAKGTEISTGARTKAKVNAGTNISVGRKPGTVVKPIVRGGRSGQ